MKAKNYTFSMKFEFVAKDEQDAKDQFQEMMDEWEVHGIFDVDNWCVDTEDVEISEKITQ
jgi:hypothetical protein